MWADQKKLSKIIGFCQSVNIINRVAEEYDKNIKERNQRADCSATTLILE